MTQREFLQAFGIFLESPARDMCRNLADLIAKYEAMRPIKDGKKPATQEVGRKR